MGWAHGVNEQGREVGYGVAATCDELDCEAQIDRGLGYLCGGLMQLYDGPGCGQFYCADHLGTAIVNDGEAVDDWSPELCRACRTAWCAVRDLRGDPGGVPVLEHAEGSDGRNV